MKRRCAHEAVGVAENDETVLQNRRAATDRQIDRLVYERYGLTEEKIGIVDGNQ